MENEQATEEISQAQRVFKRFGGPAALCRALREISKPRHKWTVQSWARSHEKGGTGGIIPAHNWPDIMKAARHKGVSLTQKDCDPRPTTIKIGVDGKRWKR